MIGKISPAARGTKKQKKRRKARSRMYKLLTRARGFQERHAFEHVTSYVMFVGYPRSGHSLVAAQMTAHKNMVISNELHALQYLEMGYGREQLLSMIRSKDQRFAARNFQSRHYTYAVPNQWQGSYEKLTVIGDKKGAGSSKALLRNPELLVQLKDTLQLPVRIIHVVRNPFDTISRIHLRSGTPLEKCVRRFFDMDRAASAVVKQHSDDVLTIYHEDYVQRPAEQLKKICKFVGVDSPESYVTDCASVVNPSPRLARKEVNWSAELMEIVNNMSANSPHLTRYQFEEEPQYQNAS